MRFLSVLVLSFTLFNHVAKASLINPGTLTLLEVKTSGGYTPLEMRGWERGIKITLSGKVFSFDKRNADSHKNYRQVATLSFDAISHLQKTIQSLPKEAKLEQLDNRPPCADAPSTSYTAGYDELVFSKRSMCQDTYLGGSYEAMKLRKLLDGFMVLNDFDKR